MEQTIKTTTLNIGKMLLSGTRRVYKTEGFISHTKKIADIDAFVSRVAESLFYEEFETGGECYSASVGSYTLLFCGAPQDGRFVHGDLVFYDYISLDEYEGGTDRRLSDFLLSNRQAKLTVAIAAQRVQKDDLSRIYLVSSTGGSVNFPLLSEAQRKIVQTENANMLVQGVAGSGKTNVCVEKIVYCASRGYRGKVLYTTFSRGLLAETKTRVSLFLKNIEDFVKFYEDGNVVFVDTEHKKAIENKLGILFDTDDDAKIVESLKRISAFLRLNVEYKLIEDIYCDYFEKKKVAGENVFFKEYIGDRRTYRLSGVLDKIKNISLEIIYKEIYGMIFGKYELSAPSDMMSRDDYAAARRESFTRAECDAIYTIALDYASFLAKNDCEDNNSMSRALIGKISAPVYSVGIIDEAQDFTQVNLCLIKRLSLKLFCVGDALQMINPSYFGFGYLKRLMYGDVTGVSELRHNYRSTQKIEAIAQKLGEMNIRRFGTHSFVLKGESVSSTATSSAIFVNERNFVPLLGDKKFENITVVVASQGKKEKLKKLLGKTEILTVAEAKGLERNTVVLVDVLSDNADKWNYLKDMTLNRKTADENSVFRYYFNLFYVGISRAKQHLFVAESDYPKMFDELFNSCFERKNKGEALNLLRDVAGRIELDDDEFLDRIEKFCGLEQYENAKAAADRLSTDDLRDEQLAYIYAHEHFLRYEQWREAGIEYWKRGLDKRAREMFTKSGDEALFPLMDACANGGGALNVDIVKFFPLVLDNDIAKELILETVKSDYAQIMANQKQINDKLKIKRKKQ